MSVVGSRSTSPGTLQVASLRVKPHRSITTMQRHRLSRHVRFLSDLHVWCAPALRTSQRRALRAPGDCDTMAPTGWFETTHANCKHTLGSQVRVRMTTGTEHQVYFVKLHNAAGIASQSARFCAALRLCLTWETDVDTLPCVGNRFRPSPTSCCIVAEGYTTEAVGVGATGAPACHVRVRCVTSQADGIGRSQRILLYAVRW